MAERVITRTEIAEALGHWLAGEWRAKDVHEWAEDLYGREDVSCDDWIEVMPDDELSVANTVLGELDRLDMNLLTEADVPALMRALESPPEATAQALERLEEEMNGRDVTARMENLRDQPPYDRILRRG